MATARAVLGVSAALLVCLLTTSAFGAPVVHEDTTLVGADTEWGDFFGQSISVDNGAVVIGARRHDHTSSVQGAAYVFRWNGNSWVEEAELVASDGNDSDNFGLSVSISGDLVVVSSTLAAAAYVFRWDGTTWSEEQKLVASDGEDGDRFGENVAVSGHEIWVSARTDDVTGEKQGSVYVFRFDGTRWNEEPKLLASDAQDEDQFGYAISLSGNKGVVGARNNEGNASGSGSAYVFRLDGTTWVEEQKLVASDAGHGDAVGSAVSIAGDVSLIGAPRNDFSENPVGSAYVFVWDGTGWIEQAKLEPSDGAPDERFAEAVAIRGEIAVVGDLLNDDAILGINSGAAYVYRWDGSNWFEESKLLGSDTGSGSSFGRSVATLGGTVFATGRRSPAGGAAYLYELGSCGNGTLDPGELCDDGGRVPGDGCGGTCELEACSNGLDDDGDGSTDFAGGDAGCWSGSDTSEWSGFLACDNGFDDDGDGFTDSLEDPACSSGTPWAPDTLAPDELTQCQDGLDNDGAAGFGAGTDFDGGESILGVGSGDPNGSDPECADKPWRDAEARKTCGVGFELAPAIALLIALRRRRRAAGGEPRSQRV